MTNPKLISAGPFANSFVGLHLDYFLEQVGVNTAPKLLQMSPQEYVPPKTFEAKKLALLTGPVGAQQLSEKANQLFVAVDKISKSSLLPVVERNIVVATIAHQAALYAYVAAGSDHKMYRLYARIHEHFAEISSLDDVGRDHVYRAVWGYAHYAQCFQDREGPWEQAWGDLATILWRAREAADPEHIDALSRYLEIAKAGPPVAPVDLDEALNTLNPGGTGETFRSVFLTELKRFLGTKDKIFPPVQHLTFTPPELADGGDRVFLTRLSIKASSEERDVHKSYPLSIRISHLSGFDEEDSSQVGTTVVSIRDGNQSLML